jgi:hypothetical protein
MHEFLWFVGGALVYKVLSVILGLTQITNVIYQLQINVIKFLGTTLEDVAYIKALKYKTMKESNVDPSQIKKAKLQDEEFFEEWKKSCIVNINNSVPNYIKLSFDNWDEVMSILAKAYRRRLDEHQKKE